MNACRAWRGAGSDTTFCREFVACRGT
jgi:hypothetical protein